MKPFFEAVLFLLGFGSILFLTYITTKYLAARTNKAMKGRHLSIVETISLGADKRIHLVKAGKKHILVASTSKSIEYLSELQMDEEEASSENTAQHTQGVFDFKALFEKYVNTYKSKKSISFRPEANTPANNPEGERFRFNLEKLRNITQKINTQIEKNGVDVTNEK